jgi:Xaa-Pro aminopeptidase
MKIRRVALRCALAAIAISFGALLVGARFPQPAAEYQARRAKLRAEVDGPVVLFGYTSRNDAGEVAVFFQDEDFYYLTGYSEPDAALLLMAEGEAGKAANGPEEILYLPPRDPRESIWGGAHLGPNDPGVAEKTGFKAVKPFAELRGDLANLAKTNPKFYALEPKGPENGIHSFTRGMRG